VHFPTSLSYQSRTMLTIAKNMVRKDSSPDRMRVMRG
jgi:hypothetical protein